MWAWTPNNLLARRKRVTTLDLSPGNFYDPSTVKVSG
jgi:peptide/nickel transport system substrate-binding protein